MTKSKLTFGAFLLTAILVPAFLAIAGDDEKSREDRIADVQRPKDDSREGSPLGRTVKLEFALHPKEEDAPRLVVLCALRDYSISRQVDGPNHRHGIVISGAVHPVDSHQSILLSFKAELRHEDVADDFQATFAAKGSTELRFGQSKTLSYLGEHALKVTATLEKREPSRGEGADVFRNQIAELKEELANTKNLLVLAKEQATKNRAIAEFAQKRAQVEKARAEDALALAKKQKALADQARLEAQKIAADLKANNALLKKALQLEKAARKEAEAARKQAEAARKQAEAAFKKLQQQLQKSNK